MEMARITINGQAVEVPVGTTILQAAKKMVGVNIPTLCHHPALSPLGGCRVCLVEVKGQRNLQPACTFPVIDGMEIETETPMLVKARKFILDMIFTERNHFCPYCEASGSCELQSLGYRYGVNHWIYPTYNTAFPTDATNRYYLMEHNRCVLCSRCVRACAELPANHTLGLGQRGAHSMIRADINVPLGSSTCISCGSCVQVCPTGAIVEKRSAFMGRDQQMSYTKSTCSHCSIGCGMTIVTRGNDVQRIDSDWDAAVNGGRLCRMGRFDPLYDERERLTSPMVRRNGRLQSASWDEALQTVASRIGNGNGAGEVGVVSSSDATNEALYLLRRLFCQELGAAKVGLLNGTVPEPPQAPAGVCTDIEDGDLVLLVGANPAIEQPVASFFIKRAIDKGVRLVIVDDQENDLLPFAWQSLPLASLDQALEIAERALRPVVLYGMGATASAVDRLKKLEQAVIIALEPGVNTRAAKALGIQPGVPTDGAKLLYFLLGEEKVKDEIVKQIGGDAFVVVQASFASALSARADVILPTAIWSEREGTLTNTEGRVQKAQKAREPVGEARPDWEVLALLAEKAGKKIGADFADLSAQAIREIKGKEI